eukprot:GFUD01127192.1.p1 GENE.GFUD01127192.1~~GFUD01127192.1.p1  ORF type:complete len:135 (-),score=36.54 GFUD01127192.1:16-420(-)
MHSVRPIVVLFPIILISATPLQPDPRRPSPCLPPTFLSSFPPTHWLLPSTPCPATTTAPTVQPVVVEQEKEEEEKFECPWTGTFPTSQDCSSYYLCSRLGEVTTKMWRCPGGTQFSHSLGVCDWKINVSCGRRK